ncbi:hypothetical protein SAMN05421858_2511 [Haladaptatus litoreus]|uniref:Uncharacterized protein n=2 Tax=Haladaptatus litoreus TaxID=553468 RepID=A0A1N7BEG6_9EURY|nr:hypothetical protein SAMN05421858_2511 [Haladaptatus litoreus]
MRDMNAARIGLWLVVLGGLALFPATYFGMGVGTTTSEYVLLYAAVLAVGFGIAFWLLHILRTFSVEWTT